MKIFIAFLILGFSHAGHCSDADLCVVVATSMLDRTLVGRNCILHADSQAVSMQGWPPPRGMIVADESGVSYLGRLDGVSERSVVISADADNFSDPLAVYSVTIPLAAIKKLEVATTRLDQTLIGREFVFHTDIQVLSIHGMMPPEEMATFDYEGLIYTGRLDGVTERDVTVSAAAGEPSNPEYRYSVTIPVASIKRIQVKNSSEQGAAAKH